MEFAWESVFGGIGQVTGERHPEYCMTAVFIGKSDMYHICEMFEASLDWLRNTYHQHHFFVERDVVWTIQKRLLWQIQSKNLPLTVFNDYGILPGKRRSLSTDLVILDRSGSVQLAAEFKYEPSHARVDIPSSKFPVVFWGKDGVEKDIGRIRDFVSQEKAKHAYSVFIDEGGYFRKRNAHMGSRWIAWGDDIWVLIAELHSN